AVRTILKNLSRTKVDLLALAEQYEKASKLVGEYPEAKLAYALVLYRHRKLDEALKPLEDIRLAKSEAVPAHQLWTWIQFTKRNYFSGLTGLTQLAAAAKPPRNAEYSEERLRLFEWAGSLREYATAVAGAGDDARVVQQAARLDAAVEQ